MKKLVTILLFTVLVVACSEKKKSRFEKIEDYFLEIGIPKSASIGILNPDNCGSCTDYSIHWLISHKSKRNNIILTTGKLKEKYFNLLKKSNFTFFNASQDKIARLGIPLAACTYVKLRQSKIEQIKTVK